MYNIDEYYTGKVTLHTICIPTNLNHTVYRYKYWWYYVGTQYTGKVTLGQAGMAQLF